MKSNTTMLALARAKAYAKDLQEIETAEGITVIGYALTLKDLSVLYKENGFTSQMVPRRHLQIWKELGRVKTFYNDVVILFVPQMTDLAQITELTLMQNQRGSSVVVILPKGVSA